MLLLLVTPCLVVAVQPWMEWIPIKKKKKNCFIEVKNKSVIKYYSSQQANQPTTTNDAPIEIKDNSKLSVGKIVAVHIKQNGSINIYIAEITDIEDVCLKYMVRAGNKYVWPNKTELSWQPIENK